MSDWRTIETAPMGIDVVLRLNDDTSTVGWKNSRHEFDWLTSYVLGPADLQKRQGVEPTHWMPLPEPPA